MIFSHKLVKFSAKGKLEYKIQNSTPLTQVWVIHHRSWEADYGYSALTLQTPTLWIDCV